MRSEEEILEGMKRFALSAAKMNDQRFGNAQKFYEYQSCATCLGWVLGFTEEETKDALAVAIIETYRESPQMMRHYFQGEIPERLRYLLDV